MSDVKATGDGDPFPAPVSVRIVPDIPTVFADGIVSQSYIAGVSKFYFFRTDSDPDVTKPAKNTVIAQIIMPAEGFAAMVHFLQHRLKMMIADKAISQEAVDRIDKTVYPPPVNARR
jgi:hypothetical protein